MYNSGLTGFLLKEDEGKTKCNGIINLLFGVLVDNTHGHSTRCSQGLHSEKYYATRKISARVIHQNTEYGVFMLYQVVPVLSF